MTTVYVTGLNNTNLQDNINAAISDGASDITIYGFNPSKITNNFDNGILAQNLRRIKALRFSDGTDFSSNAFEAVFLSDIRTLDFSGVSALSTLSPQIFLSAQMPRLKDLIFRSDMLGLAANAFKSAQMIDLETLDLSMFSSLINGSIFEDANLHRVISIAFKSGLGFLPINAFKNARIPSLMVLDLSPVNFLYQESVFEGANLSALSDLRFKNTTSNLPSRIFCSADMRNLKTLDLRNITNMSNAQIFCDTNLEKLTALLFRSDFPSLPEEMFFGANLSSLPTLDLSNVLALPNARIFAKTGLNSLTSLIFRSDLDSLPESAFDGTSDVLTTNMNALVRLDLRPVQTLSNPKIFRNVLFASLSDILFRPNLPNLGESAFEQIVAESLRKLDLSNIQALSNKNIFYKAQLPSLQEIIFRPNLPSLPESAFERAEINALQTLDLRNISDLPNANVFKETQLRNVTVLYFKSDTPKLGVGTFKETELDILPILDLRNIKTLPGVEVFQGVKLYEATELLFAENLPTLPYAAFRVAQLPKLKVLDLRNIVEFKHAISNEMFRLAQLNSVSDILFRSDTKILSVYAFGGANFSDLKKLDLSNISDLFGVSIFEMAEMNSLTSLIFKNNAVIPDRAFTSAQMNSLPVLDLSNVKKINNFGFSGLHLASASGVLLPRQTVFLSDNTFSSILAPAKDITSLDFKTNLKVLYISDYYGYAAAPVPITINQGSPANLFSDFQSDFRIKDWYGSDITGFSVNFVDNVVAPNTVGNVTIAADGTITSTGGGLYPIKIVFADSNGRVGARVFEITSIPTYNIYPPTSDTHSLRLCHQSSDMVLVLYSDVSGLLSNGILGIDDIPQYFYPYKTIFSDFIPVIEANSNTQGILTGVVILVSDNTYAPYNVINCGEERALSTSDYDLLVCEGQLLLGISGNMSPHLTTIPGSSDKFICFVLPSDLPSFSGNVGIILCSPLASDYANLTQVLLLT